MPLTYSSQCAILKYTRAIRTLCAVPEAAQDAEQVAEALAAVVERLARSTLETMEEYASQAGLSV